MKKTLKFMMMCLLLLMVAEKACAEDIIYKTLDFSKAKMEKCKVYSASWTATDGNDSWVLNHFSNNNLNWENVRCGTYKSATSASIVNKQPYEKAVSKIVITVDEIRSSIVVYARILASTDSNFNNDVQKVYFTSKFKKGGLVTCDIPQSKPNRYYKIDLSLKPNTVRKNGPIQISKIVYYTPSDSPHISGSTAFLDNTFVTLSTGNPDAKIYYTTDGSEPTDQSTAYTVPFSLNTSANVKAVAYVNGEKSAVASQNFKKVEENELISVADALHATDGTMVYVKGIVVKTDTYNNKLPYLNYYIGDAEDADENLEICKGHYLLNADINNAFQIVRGDNVIVAAQMASNNGNKMLKDPQLMRLDEYQDKAMISSAGWATFISRRTVDFSQTTDIHAYTVKYCADNNYVTLSPITVIPGNTAVVVKANTGTYALKRGNEDIMVTNNDLNFDTTEKKVERPYSIYVLSKQGNGCGFYPVKANDTIAPYKGYLTISRSETNTSKRFYAIDYPATDIKHPLRKWKKRDHIYYNLAGQRIDKHHKGIAIVDGHKILIK